MKKNYLYYLPLLAAAIGFFACSDKDHYDTLAAPDTSIENVTGLSSVAQGDTVTLQAKSENGDEHTAFIWTVNGKEVSHDAIYQFSAEKTGNYAILLETINDNGRTTTATNINVYSRYQNGGTYILNEGAVVQGDRAGTLIFIDKKGRLTNQAYYKENGTMLGDCPQDMFIANGKIYIVCQNGRNDGKLIIADAKTLKRIEGYEAELNELSLPTHVAVLGEDDVYIRDGQGIWLFHPSTRELTFIKGSRGAQKLTMAVADGKLFAPGGSGYYVIEPKKDTISQNVKMDGTVSGILRGADNNLWMSQTIGSRLSRIKGQIMKVNPTDYSIIQTNEVSKEVAYYQMQWQMAAASHITAKGDTLYISGLSSQIYRHIFSKNETQLMVDVKDYLDYKQAITYNTVAVDPTSGEVYLNTIRGNYVVGTSDINVFNLDGEKPVLVRQYKNYTRFPAGVFFTANFK